VKVDLVGLLGGKKGLDIDHSIRKDSAVEICLERTVLDNMC